MLFPSLKPFNTVPSQLEETPNFLFWLNTVLHEPALGFLSDLITYTLYLS